MITKTEIKHVEAVSKIVTLLYGQGYMLNEIARMTGETEETVADILHLFKR